MRFTEFDLTPAQRAIREHIKRGVPFSECMFRPGSEAFTEFYTRVREMRESLDLDWQDQELLDTDIGECIMIEGERIPLDVPIAEEVELDEGRLPKYGSSVKYSTVMKKIKDGNWEASTDVKPRSSLEIRDTESNKKTMIQVEEVELDEARKKKDNWSIPFDVERSGRKYIAKSGEYMVHIVPSGRSDWQTIADWDPAIKGRPQNLKDAEKAAKYMLVKKIANKNWNGPVPSALGFSEEVELDEEWRDYSNNPEYNVEVPAEKRNWQIITLAEPEKQNPNPTHFLARIEHIRKDVPTVTGKGNTQGAAIEDAYKKMLDQLGVNSDRSANPDDFKTFTADLNADFTKEYLNKFSVPFYKFVEESGNVFLVQASKEYYNEFGNEISQLGFMRAGNRIPNDKGNSTPIFGFYIKKNIVKSLGLRPNGRYTLEYVNDDSDGNAMFRLPQQPDSVVLNKHDKYKMGVPGVTIAATPKDIKEAEYQGKQVKLNSPKRGGSKKFYVYTKNDKGNVIKVAFGAKDGGGNLAVKLKDPKARRAFADRHNCEKKTDKTKPGYWACRLPRYAKSLGLSGGGTWW